MLKELQQILKTDAVTSLYQPIVDKHSGEIFAYEALSRGPSDSVLHSPIQLFDYARKYGLLSEMESLCRRKAVQGFVKLQLPGKLFINISPDVLEQSNHPKEKTVELLSEYGLSTSQVVMELTEQHPGTDESTLLKALSHYQNMGFAIALDDLGAGYSSLRLWSQAKPEFVKIDRHFIENIDTDRIKQEFVRSFVEIARSMHCKVLAEGVETEDEFEYLCKLKIDYFQGYYFCKPLASPPTSIDLGSMVPPFAQRMIKDKRALGLVVHSVQVPQTEHIEEVLQLFNHRPNINSIAVLEEEKVKGIIHRTELLELLSKPFGRDLYNRSEIATVMRQKPLSVDVALSIEQVSRLVTSRARYYQEDDFIVCKEGDFVGVGHVIDLLRQITETQIKQARHANPLTLLPGLVPINDCIDQLIKDDHEFVVAHFDIDNFKPFNDVYGFAKGDEVILALGQSLQEHSSQHHDTVGHIGGDDFIVLWNSRDWKERINRVTESFCRRVEEFYLPQHVSDGGFNCDDRYGNSRFIPLTTLSVAALEVAQEDVDSAFDISSRLSPLKHAAKKIVGNALVVNDPSQVYPIESKFLVSFVA